MDHSDINEKEDLVKITLSKNTLVLKDNGKWVAESTDLSNAINDIEKLFNEKDRLVKALSKSVYQIDELKREIIDINEMKSVILEMVLFLFHYIFIVVI